MGPAAVQEEAERTEPIDLKEAGLTLREALLEVCDKAKVWGSPDGEAFDRARLGDVSWSEARTWLIDLARELAAASRDGTLPRLGLDRLWLRADRRLVLLDFPVHGASSPASGNPAEMTSGELSGNEAHGGK